MSQTRSVTVVDPQTIQVVTPRLRATFIGPRLVRLEGPDGAALLERDPTALPAGLEVIFQNDKPIALGVKDDPRIQAVQVGERVAHVYVEDAQCDAILRISVDDAGRLIVEPSAQSLRAGLGSVQWVLSGLAKGYELVAPVYQGLRQDVEHPLIRQHFWAWPSAWEAPLAILQGRGEARGAWSVRCLDALGRPKGLGVGHEENPRSLRLRTEALGPWDHNTAAGGLAWIIDTHEGGWEAPASEYRQWLWKTYDLAAKAAMRPGWVGDIRLTLQWCRSGDLDVLEAVARIINPKHVLLHLAHDWRTDPYDHNYPAFQPSETGLRYAAEAARRGFRVLPHCNYFAMDPRHPMAQRFWPFAIRQASNKRLLGWRWQAAGSNWPFPQTLGRLSSHGEDSYTMLYIHPGCSAFRRLLAEQIALAAREMNLPGVFLDQTLCTWNADNALVENGTMVEGMLKVMRELIELPGPLALAGEGRNEMSMQYHSFAQAHLYESHGRKNCEHFGEWNAAPVGHLLYGDLCRTMGYTGLSGQTPESVQRLAVHEKLGVLPSLTVQDAQLLKDPTPAMRRVLDLATARS